MSRDTGCRPHELLKLRIKDIVFKNAGDGTQFIDSFVNLNILLQFVICIITAVHPIVLCE
ncbi:MAG: hypothetical protein WBX01_12745 [Nitrososphaeraceae archaeon]